MVCNLNCNSCPLAYLCIPAVIASLIAIKKISKLQKKRMLSQISFLLISNFSFIFGATGLIYSYFYCWEAPLALAACPIGVVEHAFADRTFYILIYLIGAIFTVSIIIGRGACGWACPVGFLQDLIRGRKIKRKDKKIRYAKYIILISIPLACFFTGKLAYTDICPIGGLTGTLPRLIINPKGYTFTVFFYPKMLFVAGFFILIIFIARGWCRYLCPVGAMMACFNKISFLQIKYNEEKCIKCFRCSQVCPMQIEMPDENRSNECIRCGRCIDACPTNAIEFKWQ